jgi:hypothetical protein
MTKLRISWSTEFILLDDEDYERCKHYSWHIAGEDKSNIRGWANNKMVGLSQHIMNDYKSMYDHKDRNFLNNQKENLRICSNSQNQMNTDKRDNTSSQYKGVSYNKKKKKWTAQIVVNKAKNHLGYFVSEKDAAKTYNQAALKYFKEFAVINQFDDLP